MAVSATTRSPRRVLRVGSLELSTDWVLGLVLAAALVAVAFVASGGSELAPNTWTEIALIAVGAGLAIAVIVLGPRAPAWGAVALGMFVALAALTALSISWSVVPDTSWIEAGRTLSYLAVFGAGIALARLWPGRWGAAVGAIAVMATVVSGWALLVKVFPATLDAGDTFGRLQAPFDYWNATGLLAALGLAPCLWAGARRGRARALGGLAAPAISILITVVVLSYSRGAVLAAVVGLAVWFLAVPLRLRGALVLGLGAAGAGVLCAFALSSHSLTHDQIPLAARTSAGHAFGLELVLVLAVVTAAGFVAAFGMDRVAVSAALRRRIGTALVVGVALIPVLGVLALAESSRGLTGEISHEFSTLTNTNSGAANTPSRLFELGNTRGRYWSEGLKVGEHALLNGVGALGYGTAATRYTTDSMVVPHAHSFVIQTFADFGLIGVAVMLALLGAWILATRRTLRGELSGTAERAGLLTMLAVVLTFGVHSAIDWTWFVPGTAVPALLCAGWLAGRGPDRQGVGVAATRPNLLDAPGRGATVIAVLAVAVVCGWAVWQPLRSQNADAAAVNALAAGHTGAALSDARAAATADPVAIDPLLELSAIYTGAGDSEAARQELQKAVALQPENPQAWLALGQFELQEHRPRLALRALERAKQLDLGSPVIGQALAQAQAAG